MNADGTPAISYWRSVFDASGPESIEPVEAPIAPKSIGQGTTSNAVSDPSWRCSTKHTQTRSCPSDRHPGR